ncbi:MAG: TPM domain-containing protein [Clostridiales bacterium]|nr:TPM domain-containing protein [Clostridiales bacterium]
MKKVIPLIALMLVLFAGNALAGIPDKPSSFQFVYDYTDTLSSADKEEIAAYGQALLDATGGSKDGDEAVALVVDFLDGMEPADYATDVINSWGLGDNSLLILLATGDRDIEIAAGRGLDRVFSAASRGEVIDENIEYLANNQFADGLVAIYEAAVLRTANLRGKTLSLPGIETTTGTQTGIANTGATGATGSDEGGGMSIFGILLIVIIAIVVIRILRGSRRRRRAGNYGPAAPIQPMRRMRSAPPPRPAGPRARAGGVFDAPPPPPQRQPRTSTPPTPARRAEDTGRMAGSILGGLFSGTSSSSSSRSSSRSSGSSSRSSSSSSGGSFGRSGGSRGSSSGRKF